MAVRKYIRYVTDEKLEKVNKKECEVNNSIFLVQEYEFIR